MSKKKKNLMNEEEIKNKIILPYLVSLGLTLEEIKFEKPTYIKAIDKKQKGRSDILCCKSGKENLFLIEVKAESKKITDKVIEQGMSYARLMQQIPPFMIATNGKETKVYDVISFKDITEKRIGEISDYWKSGLKISHAEEIGFRYQAIKNFIGYSKENLKIFSLSQTRDRMESLKGNTTNLSKKYIPELFLARKDLTDTFNEFLDSEFPLFAITGESGVGKTNYICDLTERFSENFITIFFNGTLLSDKIFASIRDDFNWFFSPNLTEMQIIERLNDLARSAQTKAIIFIDAIDEVSTENFDIELNDFVNHIRNFNNIKICITCKSSVWGNFLNKKGIPTCLNETLYPAENYYLRNIGKSKRANKGIKNPELNLQGYPIFGFTEDELDVLDNNYKKLFKYKGNLKGDVRKECKVGFMLRVVAEVYKKQQLPNTINGTTLLEEYLEKKIEKFEKGDLVKNYLYTIGTLLIENEMAIKEKDKSSLLVKETELRKSLRLSANEELLPDLFSFNILYRRENPKGDNYIGFYFTPFRDFVIVNYVLNLPKLNKNKFKEIISKLLAGPVGQSALRWYIYVSDNKEHKKALSDYFETWALIFITDYEKLINEKFPNLRSKFEPYTTGRIGIVVGPSSGGYGLRALNSESDEIVKILSSKEIEVKETQRFFSLGVQKVRFGGRSFRTKDSRDAAIEEIKKQIFEIVKDGALNEENNFFLAVEKIFAILYYYGFKLGFSIRSHIGHFPRKPIFLCLKKGLFPISLQDVLKKVNFFLVKTYYELQETKKHFPEKLRKDSKNKVFDNKLLSQEEIVKKAREAVEKNIKIPDLLIRGNFPPCEILTEAIRTVQRKQDSITNYYLPTPDLDFTKTIEEKTDNDFSPYINIDDIILLLYTRKQLKKYIEEFFKKFIEEYRIIVEKNFAALSKEFKLYSFQPIHFCIEVRRHGHYKNLNFGYRKSLKKRDVFEVEIEPKFSRLTCDNTEFKNFRGWMSIGCIFPPYSRPVPLDRRYNTRVADEECILRAWVYKYIEEELKQIFDSRTF